jgi:hypothetical protein
VTGGEKRTPGENVFEERRAPRERVRNIWDRREKNERAFAPAPAPVFSPSGAYATPALASISACGKRPAPRRRYAIDRASAR